jgi:glycosyltransferase EpsJ
LKNDGKPCILIGNKPFGGEHLPRISVIVPAYNAMGFLETCVHSITGQSFADLELILVDDGSTDGTGPLCDRLAASDPRIRVIHQENAGVSAARNCGVRAALGALIAFVDADDWLAPDAYSKMVSAMDVSSADCAVCGYDLVWPDGRQQPFPSPLPNGVYSSDAVNDALILPLLSDRISSNLVLGTVWRYLFDRTVILDHDIQFSGAYLEDEIFLIEYFSASPCRLASVDESLYSYLQNPASVTRRYLDGYAGTFAASLALKAQLVQRYAIPVPDDWRNNTCWAGLLIAVSNEFAPGNGHSLAFKVQSVKQICELPDFRHAITHYAPRGMSRNKAVVANLIRKKLYLPLAMLYTFKNRNRS